MGVDVNLVVLIVVLAVGIVGFISYSFISNKIKRDRIAKQKKQMLELENEVMAKYIARIDVVIAEQFAILDKFVVSVGILKMSDINSLAKISLANFRNSPKIIEAFVDNPFKSSDLFINNISELAKAKSNLWAKKNSENLKYFRDISHFIANYEDPKIVQFYNDEKKQFSTFYTNLIVDIQTEKMTLDDFKEKLKDYDDAQKLTSQIEKSKKTKTKFLKNGKNKHK
ncbi:Uncharacterised protein [Mesomycoplasma conjunctivae]|nr:Uncharacterised protein [Mesomycoplasma conjunctivae]